MMFKSKFAKLILILTIIVMVAAIPLQTFAFSPFAHYVLAERTAQQLVTNYPTNPIGIAMTNNPRQMAWGANGPDINYANYRAPLGYRKWADYFHRTFVASMSKSMLQIALASNDGYSLAYAGGWLAHCIADMESHGSIDVGLSMDNVDPYYWVLAGHPESQHDYSYATTLFGDYHLNSAALSMISNGTNVYAGSSGYPSWTDDANLYITGLSTGVFDGWYYTYVSYADGLAAINAAGKKDALDTAYTYIPNTAATLLQQAASGNYSGFHDSWYLDYLNPDTNYRPFGTLDLRIRTSSDWFSGTDNTIYFGLTFADGTTRTWNLDHPGMNDFEMTDDDYYSCFSSATNQTPQNVRRVFFQSVGSDSWKLQEFYTFVNGATKVHVSPNAWLNNGAYYYYNTPNGIG